MTEISNIKGGGEVISLSASSVRRPESDGGGQFLSNGNTAEAVAVSPSNAPQRPENLNIGEDPLEKAARVIEEFVPDDGPSTKLRIDKDEDTGRFVYKSIDTESGEVIKQFPPETILEIISQYRSLEGLVVDDDA